MYFRTVKIIPAFVFSCIALLPSWAFAQVQTNQVNVICSTNQEWCDAAARGFSAVTGVKVMQTRKATGEALAQIKAEANNPKTDLWWGGTGDLF